MSIVLLLGLVFSPLAAAAAFLITYDEYIHHYPDKKEPLKLALQAALFTFAVFVIISLVIGYFLSRWHK